MTSAAAPATSGAANEVPLRSRTARAASPAAATRGKRDAATLDETAEKTSSPGAASETYVPVFENDGA